MGSAQPDYASSPPRSWSVPGRARDSGLCSRDIEHFGVLVIGGGQAGLAAGYHLSKRGAHYLIVDAGARVGDPWRKRWDSLRLFTPARINGLPGMPFPAPPAAIVTKDQVADYMESYAKRFGLPIRLRVRVQSLGREDSRFVTDAGITADQAIVATGSYGTPRKPEFAAQLDRATAQLHSTEYRNPSQLAGDVLVVGAGNSGAEIAMDAATSGHRTWLSGRDTGQIPYRIAFLPPTYWLFTRLMSTDTPMGRRVAPMALTRGQPLVRLTSSELAKAGIQRVPKVVGARDGKPLLEDGRVLNVGSVVWSTGFDHTYPWIKLPIADERGHVQHTRGIVESQPGLYFVGIPFQHRISSSLIDGVGDDAKFVVDRIAG